MLRKIVVGPYQANCYVLGYKETMEGLVIDPGDDVFRIVQVITETGITIKYILITHGHIDHVGGAAELKRITGAPVYIHPLDSTGLGFPADVQVQDGDIIRLGTYSIRVLHTPGLLVRSSPAIPFLPVPSEGPIFPAVTIGGLLRG